MVKARQNNLFETDNPKQIWNVAIPVPLRKLYAYAINESIPLQPGMRVWVSFGRRRLTGYLIEPANQDTLGNFKIKSVQKVLDETPSLPFDLLDFLIKSAAYYMFPLGEVLRGALPPGIDWVESNGALKGPRLKDKTELIVSLNPDAHIDIDTLKKRAPKRAEILQVIQSQSPVSISTLRKTAKDALKHIHKLKEANFVQTEEEKVFSDPFQKGSIPKDSPPTLTGEQQDALTPIYDALNQDAYKGFLLHGITGSGKTEVYLHAAKEALKLGKGVIVLVPEITLTPQLVGRYRARFGDKLAVLHSGLSDRERYDQWRLLKEGEVNVAIGVRSAIFAPVQNLGLIIVDEEHDGSFKQERGFPYNARDLSLLRASLCKAVTILGSATPSLESFNNAQTGKLGLLSLKKRATNATLPTIDILNLKNHKSGPSNQSVISGPLFHAINETIAKNEQVILFLNRRGFAPNLICKACGTIIKCDDCSVSMTLHRRPPLLVCHYCGVKKPEPSRCPSCNSKAVMALGTGTQKVEELLQSLFPTAKIDRLDRDVASNAKKAEEVLNRLKTKEIDILVGTQMVTKGHDFPDVTLVGVLQSDVGLHMPDFRASERTFHLLTQVAGRAGRAQKQGCALVQTYSPEHPAIIYAKEHDYISFAKYELQTRQELGYPPFGKLAAVRLNSPDETAVESAARTFMTHLKDAWFAAQKPNVVLLGPTPSPLEFLQNRYRWQIIIKAQTYSELKQVVAPILKYVEAPPKNVRVRLDIDPVSML